MTEVQPIVVTMADVRAANMCSGGARYFFKRNGLDWQDFLRNGIPAKTLIELGDPMALQVVEAANGRK
jgi:hypothetical protein